MPSKLLSCLPGMRWIPHDIPTQDPPPSDSPQKQTLTSRLIKAPFKPSPPNHGTPLQRRKSTISLCSTPDAELGRRTSAQAQSAFFAKLPGEIRVLIYEFVVAGEGEVVHLTLGAKRRFGHFVCEGAHEMGMGGMAGCGCKVLVGGREGGGKVGGGVMGLLRCCRRVYSEAIPHLYHPLTFSILHITHLLYLPSRLPTPRLHSIRHLRLRWSIRALPLLRRGPSRRLAYPEDTSNWARGWSILADMQGLRELCVVLIDPSRDAMWERQWLELEEELLEPVAKLRVKWAEVWLPYQSCGVEWDMGDSGVRLRRPFEEEDVEGEEGGGGV